MSWLKKIINFLKCSINSMSRILNKLYKVCTKIDVFNKYWLHSSLNWNSRYVNCYEQHWYYYTWGTVDECLHQQYEKNNIILYKHFVKGFMKWTIIYLLERERESERRVRERERVREWIWFTCWKVLFLMRIELSKIY